MFKNIFSDIRQGLNTINGKLSMAGGIVAALLGSIAQIIDFLGKEFTILLISTGVFIITLKIAYVIISAKVDVMGYLRPKYSRTIIVIAYVLGYSPILIPIGVLTAMFLPSKQCKPDYQKVLVLVSRFSEFASDDGFSYKLTTGLRSKNYRKDSVEILKDRQFLDIGALNYEDTAKALFDRYCFSKGLLVYGNRSATSQLFDCSVFIHALPNLTSTPFISDAKTEEVLYIQNPELITFSIDSQAQCVINFVLGLLDYNAHNYTKASERFMEITRICNDRNKLASYCYLYTGNAFLQNKDYRNAKESYALGLAIDEENPYLHYNQGLCLITMKDTNSAMEEFLIAEKIDPNLKFTNLKIADAQQGEEKIYMQTHRISSKIYSLDTQDVLKTHDFQSVVMQKGNMTICDTCKYYISKGETGKYGIYEKFTNISIAPRIFDTIIKLRYIEKKDRVLTDKELGQNGITIFYCLKKNGLYGCLNTNFSLHDKYMAGDRVSILNYRDFLKYKTIEDVTNLIEKRYPNLIRYPIRKP